MKIGDIMIIKTIHPKKSSGALFLKHWLKYLAVGLVAAISIWGGPAAQSKTSSHLSFCSGKNQCGVIDAAGNIVVLAIFGDVGHFADNGLVKVTFGNKRYPVTVSGRYIGFTTADVDAEYKRVIAEKQR